ncbi:nuclear transport factor 2 family protein [Mycobacterium sp.]|uniref:nuclear transport factor 2 family protein n=1 Tax=Mycobacterium sp. TaxID=1785 RepID=UPI003C74FCD0
MTNMPAAVRGAGRRPEDAAAFVEFVERATNESRADAIYEIFAADARSVMITDGAWEESVGVHAIHDTWSTTCSTFKACHFRLEKTLVAATDDTIVNDWRGGPRGRRDSCGIEVWRFDHHGKVIDLQFYNYLKIRPTLHPIQALRLLLGSPTMTIVAAWARLRQR